MCEVFFAFRFELVVQKGVILGVIPRESRKVKVLKLLHYSHQEEQVTLRNARDIVYSPNLNRGQKVQHLQSISLRTVGAKHHFVKCFLQHVGA